MKLYVLVLCSLFLPLVSFCSDESGTGVKANHHCKTVDMDGSAARHLTQVLRSFQRYNNQVRLICHKLHAGTLLSDEERDVLADVCRDILNTQYAKLSYDDYYALSHVLRYINPPSREVISEIPYEK